MARTTSASAAAWTPSANAGEHFAGEVVVQSSVLLALLLGGTWLGLACGLSITRAHLPAALGALLMLAWLRGRQLNDSVMPAAAALAALALLAGSVMLALQAYDVSYDGSAYHQVGVVALRDGWNPITQPHVVDWSDAAYPDRRWLADRIADRGLWTDHFPKAVWMLGALVSSTTGSLDAAKWPRGFIAVVALLALYRGLVASGLARPLALLCALVATISPVTLSQVNSNYVDGALAGMLATLVGVMLSWLARHRRSDLLVALVMVALVTNVKSTGAVYAVPLVLAGLGLGLVRRWRPGPADAGLLLAGLLFTLGVSWQTYAHNALSHGHPLYPASNSSVMRGQMPDDFLDRGRLAKFVHSQMQEPGTERVLPAPSFIVPRPWHYRLPVQLTDLRVAAFGTHFIYAAGLAVLTGLAAIAALLLRRSLRGGPEALALVFLWALGSTLVHPELWWLRYVPQLWWLPLLAAALAASLGWRTMVLLNLAPAAAASALMLIFWAQNMAQERPRAQQQLAALARSGRVGVADDVQNAPLLYVLSQHLAERGAVIELRPPGSCSGSRLGGVRFCASEAPAGSATR